MKKKSFGHKKKNFFPGAIIGRFSSGFTMVEIVVVFSIISVLSVIGIASFTKNSETQSIQSAVNDVAAMLNLAKSRALSQIKPAQCDSNDTLSEYRVKITGSDRYRLIVDCEGTHDIIVKRLPENVRFDASGTSPTTFVFPVLSGGVEQNGEIEIKGFGKTETIKVDRLGGIKIE